MLSRTMLPIRAKENERNLAEIGVQGLHEGGLPDHFFHERRRPDRGPDHLQAVRGHIIRLQGHIDGNRHGRRREHVEEIGAEHLPHLRKALFPGNEFRAADAGEGIQVGLPCHGLVLGHFLAEDHGDLHVLLEIVRDAPGVDQQERGDADEQQHQGDADHRRNPGAGHAPPDGPVFPFFHAVFP